MANKIDTAIDAVKTKLEELVATETVKAVELKLHNPVTEKRVPVIGLYLLQAGRSGGDAAPQWKVRLTLKILTRCKAESASETITELIAAATPKLDELSNSSDIQAGIEFGTWQFVYHMNVTNSPVGATCILTLTFDGAL